MFKLRIPSAAISLRGVRGDDAVFLGWLKVGGEEVLPLYTITSTRHPSCGSTVIEGKLRTLNLRIPRTPPPQGQVKKS